MSPFIPFAVPLGGDVLAPAAVAVAEVEACGGREVVDVEGTCLVSAAFLGASGVDIQPPIVNWIEGSREMERTKMWSDDKGCGEQRGADKG